jgi:hypothetical protein
MPWPCSLRSSAACRRRACLCFQCVRDHFGKADLAAATASSRSLADAFGMSHSGLRVDGSTPCPALSPERRAPATMLLKDVKSTEVIVAGLGDCCEVRLESVSGAKCVCPRWVRSMKRGLPLVSDVTGLDRSMGGFKSVRYLPTWGFRLLVQRTHTKRRPVNGQVMTRARLAELPHARPRSPGGTPRMVSL